MISKNKIKLIRSLEHKKYRQEENLFLTEGNKLVAEALRSEYEVAALVCTAEFFRANPAGRLAGEFIEATEDEIRKCSLLKNPQQALALCKIPKTDFDFSSRKNSLTIALDGIQDPGNLGTILRIADWFGITTLFASETAADVYNPKTVQASMGAIFRVRVIYTDIPSLIIQAEAEGISSFGAFLDGKNIYTAKLPEAALIIVGNEGQGISLQAEKEITNRIFIPPCLSNPSQRPESLNVSAATAIICSEFRRSKLSDYSK